ncbi:MAG TPA: ATP-binding protein [Blastocatellia bacterium]|jgi:signal transduction histidine kinase|nr:ATP-binding protein [Blastocatellia bacterium]
MGISSGINSLRLRSKFYLSFGAVLMLGTLVAALMMAMMIRSSSSYKLVLETDRGVAELALTIRVDKLRISDSLRGRLLHPYGDLGEQELKNLSAAYEELQNSYSHTRRLASDPRLIETLNAIEAIDQERLSLLEKRILQAIEQQESATAEQLYFDEYTPARLEQQELLDRLGELASTRITESVARTSSQSRLVSIIAGALTLMLLVGGCVLSYYLTRSFERPISELMIAARAIASGDLNRKLSLDRKDELGEMAEVLNQMVGNLRGLNDDLANQVRWLRETKDELAKTQGHMVRQEKMVALGQLVAGVAHELNNPISFVYSNTMLLKDSFAQLHRVLDYYDSVQGIAGEFEKRAGEIKSEIDYDYLVPDIAQALADCHEGARRVRDIVLNLRTFSRLDDSELQRADIAEGIESTAKILGQFFRPDRVVLHREYGKLPEIECYAGQLSQVWMNLMVNAAQAMNSKGDLWIGARVEGDRLVVTFRDNGPGIPDDVVSKIFDPFFTTKKVGDGTGLGLSIVHGIIERHGGEIRVETRIGVGTTFVVELPLTKPATAETILDEETEGAFA